jgi:hypothetical protein
MRNVLECWSTHQYHPYILRCFNRALDLDFIRVSNCQRRGQALGCSIGIIVRTRRSEILAFPTGSAGGNGWRHVQHGRARGGVDPVLEAYLEYCGVFSESGRTTQSRPRNIGRKSFIHRSRSNVSTYQSKKGPPPTIFCHMWL